MARLCYCSEVLPGKAGLIRAHWADKEEVDESGFWGRLRMSGFECWLQEGRDRDLMIHCLEGTEPDEILPGLRRLIREGHLTAKKLQSYYLEVLGLDYADPAVSPQVECLVDLQLTDAPCVDKRGLAARLGHRGVSPNGSSAEPMKVFS